MDKINELAKILLQKKVTVATAESCTGGLLAATLTSISGSSSYFNLGFITYSNESKINVLGIDAKTLESYGAVSSETAIAMAKNIKNIAGADIGVSITGIAGPTGSTNEKPIGLVYIAIIDDKKVFFEENIFLGNRDLIRRQAVDSAISHLIKISNEETLKNNA